MRFPLQHMLLLALTLWAGLPAGAQGNVKVAGMNHFLVLKDDGTVWGFGDCMEGELGPVVADCKYVRKPIQIEMPGKVIDIAASDW
jgi:alpha-tubulin suppressor-like RCC1 family protein